MITIIKSLFALLFFPFVFPWRIIHSNKSDLVKALTCFFSLLLLFPLWLLFASVFTFIGFIILRNQGIKAGLVQEYRYISGTGSMYPTFPKGEGKTDLERMNEVAGTAKARRYPGGIIILGKKYFDYSLGREDIVFFANEKTREIIDRESSGSASLDTGFVKRAIALPGDSLEIRDGFVYINDQIISEPYTAKPRSTYGGEFLPDCKQITIPEGFVFVMGDNRKGSNDSRFDVGFVKLTDIRSVIPLSEQNDLMAGWHDTKNDTSTAHKPVLDVYNYLELLNNKRRADGLKPLKYQDKLEQSAKKRADIIIKFNDFSFEATRSGYTMEKSMQDAGYSNIVWGEASTGGFYEADELIENYFEFPSWRKFLLNPEFQETGIGAVVGEINDCPVQVVVQHFAGYVAPNYKKQDIESWKNALATLGEIRTGWEGLKSSGKFYEENRIDIDRITTLINERINAISKIVNRMEANQWLTPEEKNLVARDKALGEEQQALASKLNDKVNQSNSDNR